MALQASPGKWFAFQIWMGPRTYGSVTAQHQDPHFNWPECFKFNLVDPYSQSTYRSGKFQVFW